MDFNQLLKVSLSVVNEGYNAALTDLTDVAQQLRLAVHENAGERFDLGVSEILNDMKGVTFRVYFDTNVQSARAPVIDVGYLRIPSNGYPILSGTFTKSIKSFSVGGKIDDKEKLTEYFARFIQDPDSPLIQAIGFALRNQDDEEEEESPF